MDFIALLRGIGGIIVLLGIAYLLSNNKKRINYKLIINGLLIQITLAVLIIKGDVLGKIFAPFGWFKGIFSGISYFFVLVLNFTTEGAKFVFGALAVGPGNSESIGVFFAFQVLPTIIFFSSLMSILYYAGVMQKIVGFMAKIMVRILGTSGAESLSCTANIFVGQTEAPLMIKPYLSTMTRSEILTIMIGGMATIAGGVMAAYIQILGGSFAETMGLEINEARHIFATHLLSASVMAAPAALLISKILFPETSEPATKGKVSVNISKSGSNIIEAAAIGAGDGLKLAANVAGMLLAFIALIAMTNYFLELAGNLAGINDYLVSEYGKPLNLQFILGSILRVLAFLIGVPWESSLQFGSLLGTKIVLNEFVAYLDMGTLIVSKQLVNDKTILMATYALCGFANFSSIAIQIGGLTPMAPERRADFASLGIKAVIGGTLATLMTATIAGVLF